MPLSSKTCSPRLLKRAAPFSRLSDRFGVEVHFDCGSGPHCTRKLLLTLQSSAGICWQSHVHAHVVRRCSPRAQQVPHSSSKAARKLRTGSLVKAVLLCKTCAPGLLERAALFKMFSDRLWVKALRLRTSLGKKAPADLAEQCWDLFAGSCAHPSLVRMQSRSSAGPSQQQQGGMQAQDRLSGHHRAACCQLQGLAAGYRLICAITTAWCQLAAQLKTAP